MIHSIDHQLALKINPMLLFIYPSEYILAARLDQLLNQELT